ncbi:MAG TPA: SCP2 sterol-binding domain-containing protein [Acidobacteriota bacterium]|nr:SCP2 sterol-binding domain-containing protein [Acidobacteriota bacterium]
MMSIDVFSDAWAEQWKVRINRSEAYAKAAQDWVGALVMVQDGGEGSQSPAVYADLRQGRCIEARAARPSDLEEADFVIAASQETWKSLFGGALDPMFAVLQGRLQLRKGKTAELLPYAKAAREMVMAARDIDTR